MGKVDFVFLGPGSSGTCIAAAPPMEASFHLLNALRVVARVLIGVFFTVDIGGVVVSGSSAVISAIKYIKIVVSSAVLVSVVITTSIAASRSYSSVSNNSSIKTFSLTLLFCVTTGGSTFSSSSPISA